jgi:hypothetical protein
MSFLSSLTSGVSGAVECAFSEVLSVGQSGSGSFFEGDLRISLPAVCRICVKTTERGKLVDVRLLTNLSVLRFEMFCFESVI